MARGFRSGSMLARAGIVALATVAATPIMAAQDGIKVDIPAQPLGQALRAFGRDARIQIVFDEKLMADRSSPAVNGRMTVESAFDRLLRDSGLAVTRTPQGVYVVAPRGGDQGSVPAEDKTIQGGRFNGTADQASSDIVVTGNRGTPNGVTNTTPGGGLMAEQTGTKLRSTITRDYIDKQLAVSNSFALIKDLPGVVFSSSEAFSGSSAGTSFLTIRGLTQNSIGFNFEGMPVGDQLSYSAYPGEWSDSENIGLVNLTRGSTDITAPVYNSVGALLQQELIAPAKRAGGYVSVSAGNHELLRQFVRLETGLIGDSGVRGFVSFSNTTSDNWRGPGSSTRHHVDSKFVKDWSNGSSVSLVATYNAERADQLRFPNLAQWNAQGRSFNFSDTYTPGNTLYSKLRIADRQTVYVSAPSTIMLAAPLALVVTPYFLYSHGYGNGAGTLSINGSFYGNQPAGPLQVPAGSTSPLTVMNVDTYDQKTYGQNSYLRFDYAGNSQLRFGYWYSHFQHRELSAYEPVDANGRVVDPYGERGAVLLPNGQPLRSFGARFDQDLHGIYLDNTTKLLDDRILFNIGVKQVWIGRYATNPLPGATSPTQSRHVETLPQASFRFSFDDSNQVFADVTTAFRVPSSISSYIDIFNIANGTKSSSATAVYKTEYSVGREIGFRHHGFVNLTVAAFAYDLANRQVQGTQVINGNNVGFAVNVGQQTARGVEGEIGLRRWHGFSPYASAQYLDAKTQSDYPILGDFLPTRGKRAVLSPTFVGALGLSYDDNHVFANADANHSSSQFATFTNDEVLPAFTTLNIGGGYRFGNLGPIRRPQIQFNINNVTDNSYLSGIRGVTPNAVATICRNGTLIPAAAPTYYIGGGSRRVAVAERGVLNDRGGSRSVQCSEPRRVFLRLLSVRRSLYDEDAEHVFS